VNDDQTERLARAKGGDGPAFEELLAPLVEPAFRLAMTILKDTSAAEDAVQESALNAWRHLGRLRRGAALRPWFLAMVASECRDARRTRWWSVQRFAHIVQKEVRDQHWADRMDLDAALDRLPRYHLQVLVLYYHPNDALVACDNDSAPDGIRSLVRFPAAAGRDYRAYVDGVNAAQGEIHLNWKMGQPPLFFPVPPINPVLRLGDAFQLAVPTQTNAFPASHFQWLRNGVAIVGATNSTLIINHLLGTQGGTYSVVASNAFGATTNTVAVLTVEIPYLTFEPRLINGAFRLWLQGPPGQSLILEQSSDLRSWTPVLTNTAALPIYQDFPANSFPQHFFRARPWP